MNKKIYYGIFFSLWGLILIASTLGFINVDLSTWWPLLITIPSLRIVLFEKKKSMASLIFVISIMLLLVSNHIIEREIIIKLIMPFTILTIGCLLLIGGITKNK